MLAYSKAVAYLSNVWRLRHFWISMVKLDLQARYRRSILGIGWSLLHPVAMASVLSLVFYRLFDLELSQYLPFVLSGIAIWNLLTASAMEGCHCLYAAEKYIRAVPLPLAVYPLRTALGVGFHFLIVLALAMLVTALCRGYPNPLALLALIPSLVLLFLFTWSLATIFGFINVYFPDTNHLTQVAFQVLYYLTPIFYPPEIFKDNLVQTIVKVNPLASFVALIREPLLNSQLPSPEVVLVGVLTTLVTMCLAVTVLTTQEKRLIFYL